MTSTTRMGLMAPDSISGKTDRLQKLDACHRRHLPWGSVPFGGFSSGDRCTALPPLYRPLSGFHTLSAVYSLPDLVALFHATSVHRILVFRAFPSSSAGISFDIGCSLVVSPACRSFRFPVHHGSPFPSVTRLAHLPCAQRRAPIVHLCSAPDFSLASHSACAE